jgi:membrane-bound ClpP family serine protease
LALDLLQLRLLQLQLHSELLLLFARGWGCAHCFLLISTPGGSVSDLSTKIARQVHSADVRVRILFPLGFAFFLVLALLTG